MATKPRPRSKPRAIAPGYVAPSQERVVTWLSSAPPGSRICYHEGAYIDCQTNAVARTMLEACEAGLVHLTQQRSNNRKYFRYLATRASKRRQLEMDSG